MFIVTFIAGLILVLNPVEFFFMEPKLRKPERRALNFQVYWNMVVMGALVFVAYHAVPHIMALPEPFLGWLMLWAGTILETLLFIWGVWAPMKKYWANRGK